MNKEMAGLLEKLANQLGTTSQYLWAALIRQAPIEGWVSIAQYAAIVAGLCVWFRSFAAALKLDYIGEARGMTLIVTGILIAILTLVAFFSIGDTISAFANPEYWALHRVLDSVGH